MIHNFSCIIKIACLFICMFLSTQIHANEKTKNEFILVLSSYNPDTYRVAGFLSELEKNLYENGNQDKIIIKNLQYGTLNDVAAWKGRMKKILQEHNNGNLKAILLLGQEAWSAYLNQDTLYQNTPFYACFVSDNVLELPNAPISSEWVPNMFDGKQKGAQLGNGGGYFTHYDVDANINLIKQIYPSVSNIAFLSDNSYGGVAIQTLVKQKLKKHPELSLTLLDSRKSKISDIKDQITHLPPNSAILIGTWRIDSEGSYFSKHTLQDIIPNHLSTPVFTLTGLGLESVAIGGCIPDYEVNAKAIAEDLCLYYSQKKNPTFVFWSKNYYHFDKANLKKFGIREFQLPPNSIIEDKLESKLKKYQDLILLGSIALFTLVTLTFRLMLTEYRLRNKQTELIHAVKEAERSEKLKSAFLANMSHEIRTPLNAIVGFSELLIQSEDQEDKHQFGHLIKHNNDLLLNLINDLLDLSKIEAGYIEFIPDNVNLHQFITHLYSLFKIRIHPSVELICDTPDPTLWVKIDPKKTMQIMTNYLSNAIKFTPEGSIRFGCKIQESQLYFYVEDTGIGISAEDQPKIFSRFQKIDTFAQGTGLGLSISKAIAVAAGGEVGFESIKGNGSCFWCYIPYEQTDPVSA